MGFSNLDISYGTAEISASCCANLPARGNISNKSALFSSSMQGPVPPTSKTNRKVTPLTKDCVTKELAKFLNQF